MVLDDVIALLSGEQDCVAITEGDGAVKGVLTRAGVLRALKRREPSSNAAWGSKDER